MWFFEFITKYGMALSLVGQFFLAIAMLYAKSQFAPSALSQTVEKHKDEVLQHIHGLDKRISKAEENLKQLPSTHEFHELKLEMCNLSGELKRVDQTLEGFKEHLKRGEKQFNIINDYLRSQK